jgi:hypothetical protein
VNLGTLYLVLAAALIFGACVFATKKASRSLNLKQMLLIALIAMLGVVLIWIFLSLWSKKREDTPTPVLLPDYSTDAADSTKSGLATGTSTGAGSIDTITQSCTAPSAPSFTTSPSLRPISACPMAA